MIPTKIRLSLKCSTVATMPGEEKSSETTTYSRDSDQKKGRRRERRRRQGSGGPRMLNSARSGAIRENGKATAKNFFQKRADDGRQSANRAGAQPEVKNNSSG